MGFACFLAATKGRQGKETKIHYCHAPVSAAEGEEGGQVTIYYLTRYHYSRPSRKPSYPRPAPRWLHQQLWNFWVWLLLLYFEDPEGDAGARRREAMRAKTRASGREPETKPTEEEVNNENI